MVTPTPSRGYPAQSRGQLSHVIQNLFKQIYDMNRKICRSLNSQVRVLTISGGGGGGGREGGGSLMTCQIDKMESYLLKQMAAAVTDRVEEFLSCFLPRCSRVARTTKAEPEPLVIAEPGEPQPPPRH